MTRGLTQYFPRQLRQVHMEGGGFYETFSDRLRDRICFFAFGLSIGIVVSVLVAIARGA